MSAELLRQAATILRERATVATPGPWRFTDSETVDDVWEAGLAVVNDERQPVAFVADQWYEENEPGDVTPLLDATWMATMHPGVGLALADWLELEAVVCCDDEDKQRVAAVSLARLIVGDG